MQGHLCSEQTVTANLLPKYIENQYISISCRKISLHLKIVHLVPTEKFHVHFCSTYFHLKPKKARTVFHSLAFSKLVLVIFNPFSHRPDVPGFLRREWGLAAFV